MHGTRRLTSVFSVDQSVFVLNMCKGSEEGWEEACSRDQVIDVNQSLWGNDGVRRRVPSRGAQNALPFSSKTQTRPFNDQCGISRRFRAEIFVRYELRRKYCSF